jgi:hypothetical protein
MVSIQHNHSYIHTNSELHYKNTTYKYAWSPNKKKITDLQVRKKS